MDVVRLPFEMDGLARLERCVVILQADNLSINFAQKLFYRRFLMRFCNH